jgi:hypothetical protein
MFSLKKNDFFKRVGAYKQTKLLEFYVPYLNL